jgi:hypothetical protein
LQTFDCCMVAVALVLFVQEGDSPGALRVFVPETSAIANLICLPAPSAELSACVGLKSSDSPPGAAANRTAARSNAERSGKRPLLASVLSASARKPPSSIC